MSLTSWVRSHAVALLAAAAVLAGGGTVAALGVGLLALATGTDALAVAGGTVAAVALFGTLTVVLTAAFAWTLVGRTVARLGAGVDAGRRRLADALARPGTRPDRLADRRLRLADRIAPADYDPVLEPLVRAYVDGELSERGFERRLDRLVEAGRVDAADARSRPPKADDADAFDRDLRAALAANGPRSTAPDPDPAPTDPTEVDPTARSAPARRLGERTSARDPDLD